MSIPTISILAAIQKGDRGLGFQNDLLYKISDDLKRFKQFTTGHPIIMGRKTFESIGRPLPNRTNIVITRNKEWLHENVIIVSTVEEAIAKAKKIEEKEIFIIGGGEIYTQALPYTDRLYLTVIKGNKKADAFFPEYEHLFTNTREHTGTLIDPVSGVSYEHLTLEK